MSNVLENLIQSKVKRKLLELFLFNTNKNYHTRELSRLIDEPISAVQRETKKLVAAQIIHRYPQGNQVNYFVNTQNPFYDDFKRVILKATTEPKNIFKLLVKTKSLEIVLLHSHTVKHPMDFSKPIQLLVIGTLAQEVVEEYLKATMEIFNREYELTYYSPEEFSILKETDKAIQLIFKNKKNVLYLKGGE
ncbi:MAG: hypothetical protein PHF25_03440 [Candidatus Margulisbacteria bacterium]|nr:hypothetical protein [Candidatus Margulisiibacteriota bacterium]